MRPNGLRALAIIGSACLLAVAAFAKDKSPLPEWVLRAHTVAVVLDPDAGISVGDPNANQTAQKDVETALLNWGRFEPVMGTQGADLIIVLRKGHGKLAEETLPDTRQNSRAGVINPTDNGVGIGAQHGAQPGLSGGRTNDGNQIGDRGARPKAEIGSPDDSFVVYEGHRENPLDAPSLWRWTGKNALHTHDVPAVTEFRKAVAETEKQAAKQASNQPPKKP